ncbi:hypothetical protein C0J52_04844 [Blattella germanica]|nr:hypothetical protein C0J52_04844 [Blattella germanica]
MISCVVHGRDGWAEAQDGAWRISYIAVVHQSWKLEQLECSLYRIWKTKDCQNSAIRQTLESATERKGPVEQPCLRPVQHSQDHQLLGAQRSSVCTFCLANQKKMKASASQNLPEQYNFSVSTHSSMMFYSPQTMVSVTTSEMSPYFY